MQRLIYAEQRKADLNQAQFVRRWKIHGGFAMRFADFFDPVLRYTLNDRYLLVPSSEGFNDHFSGVGELFYSTPEDMDHSLACPNIAAIFEDGDCVFSRDGTIHLSGPYDEICASPDLGIKIFNFISHGEALSKDEGIGLIDRLARDFASGLEAGGKRYGVTVTHSFGSDRNSVLEMGFEHLSEALEGWSVWGKIFSAATVDESQAQWESVPVLVRASVMYDEARYSE